MSESKAGRPRRPVTDEMVREALGDSDVRSLMFSEGAKYAKILDGDQIESASYEALMKALSYHREEFGQKFTTSLYRFLHFELKREVGHALRLRSGQVDVDVSDVAAEPDPDDVDELERVRRERIRPVLEAARRYLPKDIQTVVNQHFFEQMNFEEIAQFNGFTRETARQKLDYGIQRLQTVLANEP